MKMPLVFLAIMVAGTLAAQVPGVPGVPGLPGVPGVPGVPNVPGVPSGVPSVPSGVPGVQTHGTKGADYTSEDLAKELNLTADQQTKVRAIFADTHQRAQALEPKMSEEREALKTAVKAGDDSEIDRILQQNSQVNADFQAMHVKAMAKVYALLTPDQKVKFDQLDSGWFGPGASRRHANGK
jgi:Spy/CpxP family protein refolding chaperone